MGAKRYLKLERETVEREDLFQKYFRVKGPQQFSVYYLIPTILFFVLGFFVGQQEVKHWPSPIPPRIEVDVVSLNDRALRMVDKRDFKGAIAAFIEVTEIAPRNPMGYSNLAFTYKILGQLDKAQEAIAIAMDLNPEDPTVLNNKGSIQYHLRKYKAAERTYKKALSIDPNHTEALFNLALLFESQSQWVPAIAYYQKFLKLTDNKNLKQKVKQRIRILHSLNASEGQRRGW